MKQNQIIIAILVLIAALGAGFFGGMEYQKTQGRTAFGQGGGFQRANMGGTRGGGAAFGTILSKDANSITVSVMGGGSKIILISDSTSIGKLASGTPADLTIGEGVVANGTDNSDGSISATTIQIRPAGMGGRGQ